MEQHIEDVTGESADGKTAKEKKYLEDRGTNIMRMKMTVVWDVEPCSLVEVYRCFRGTCCLHYLVDEHLHLSYTRYELPQISFGPVYDPV
jgi:hypothetical protein